MSIACCWATRCCWAIRACSGLRHLQLARLLGRDHPGDLALDRREQVVLLRDLRLDRLLGGGAGRDDLLLGGLRLGEQLAVPLHGPPEDLDLTEDVRVERGDAARPVHPVDHVVEAAGAEDHLERRCLIRCVERHEPLCDPALADLQVLPGDPELVPVLLQVALNLRELGGGRRVLRPRALEVIREAAQLTHHLLGLGPLRRHRGVGKCRHCRRQGDADHRKYVWRLSQATNECPLLGAGTGAPGGAGTSRRQDVSRPSGRLRQKNHPNPAPNLCKSARSTVGSPPKLWYGPARARAGTHAATALAAVRRLRPGRPCGPCTRFSRVDAVCSRHCARRTCSWRPRSAPPSCSCIRSRSSSPRPGADRVAEPESRLAARRAREPRAPARDREGRVAHRADTARPPAAHALRAGERRAARDRVRREEPRRGPVEPRQPEPRHGPERRRPPPAEDGPGAAGRHLEQAGRPPAGAHERHAAGSGPGGVARRRRAPPARPTSPRSPPSGA